MIVVVMVGMPTHRQEPTPKFNAKSFSAVFLNNDQVFFGHITDATNKNIVLSDVYYLKASSDLVKQTDTSKDATTAAQLSLAKLGQELHRPKDEMWINHQNILYIEELGTTGPVMDAIHQHEK